MVDETRGIYSRPPLDRQDLNFIVQHLEITLTAGDQVYGLGEDFIGKAFIVADKTNPDRRQLPQVIIFNFSDGNIEFVSQAGGN